MSDYSGTPLYQKLGLKPETRIALLHAPAGYFRVLSDQYPTATEALSDQFDWLQAFYTDQEQLSNEFPELKEHLLPSGQLWISWPKQSSGAQTSLNENVVRGIGLATGLVDVKIAAIDDTWSGLKFVWRRHDR